MKLSEFLTEFKNCSTFKIYENLATVEWENYTSEDVDQFRKHLKTIMDLTFNFLNSLKNNKLIYAKQVYQNLKIFVTNVDNVKEVRESQEFKEFIRRWTDATNFFSLYLPSKCFKHTDLLNDYLCDSSTICKSGAIKDYSGGFDDNSHYTGSIPLFEKLQQEGDYHRNKKRTLTLLQHSRTNIYKLKLLLLALRKCYGVCHYSKSMNTIEHDNTVIIETSFDTFPVYTVFYLLLFEESDAQISAKHLLLQRTKISLMKFFCVFNQITDSLPLNQIESFVLHTNADTINLDDRTFKAAESQPLFPKRYYQLNEKGGEYKCLDNDVLKMLENSINIDLLVEIFAEYVLNGKKISLQNPMLALYHTAFVNENIIQIGKNESKFHIDFISGSLKCAETENFRMLFIRRIQEIKNLSEEKSWNYIKSVILNLSETFGKERNMMCYKTFKIFEKEKEQMVKSFFQKFKFAMNQPNERELDEIVKAEFGIKCLLLDAEYINKNSLNDTMEIIKEVFFNNLTEATLEMMKNKVCVFKQGTSLSKINIQLGTKIQQMMEAFVKSDQKYVLCITAAFPQLTELFVMNIVKNNYIFVTLSLLKYFLQRNLNKDILEKKILIIKDDENIKSVEPKDISILPNYITSKQKIVFIMPRQNSLQSFVKDNFESRISEFCDEKNEFVNWPVSLKAELKNMDFIFQQKSVSVKNLTDETEDVITADLIERFLNNEKNDIKNTIENYESENCLNYISRTFLFKNGYEHEIYSEDDLLNKSETLLTIVGSVGMGKSTLFSKLIDETQRNETNLLWTINVDLKKYLFLFQNMDFCDDDEIEMIFYDFDSDKLDYGMILLRSCLTTDNEEDEKLDIENLNFEKRLFTHYFDNNKLCIFIDGIDEIPNYFYPKVFQCIKKIRHYTDNKIYISTRPELQTLIENYFSIKAYTMVPLTQKENEHLVKEYWMTKFHFSEKDADMGYNAFNIETCLQNISVEKLALDTYSPLFVGITADLFASGKTSLNFIKFFHFIQFFIEEKVNSILMIENEIEKEKIHCEIFHIGAIQKLFGEPNLYLQKLLKENTCVTQYEKLSIENLWYNTNDNGCFEYAFHPLFNEYVAVNYFLDNLQFSKDTVFEIFNALLTKLTKTFDYFFIEAIKVKGYLFTSSFESKNLLNYCVEKNYENIVKCLLIHEYESNYAKQKNIFDAIKCAEKFCHSNLVAILLHPFLLTKTEENLIRQNNILSTELTYHIDNFVFDSGTHKNNQAQELFYKKLLLLSKKISTETNKLLTNASEDFRRFACSVGFLYDPIWTQSIIKLHRIEDERIYDDYSLCSYKLDTLNEDDQKYTILDLVNKSLFYTDQKKLETTKTLLEANLTNVSYSFETSVCDDKYSYIMCILEAAIVNDHYYTFVHFISQANANNCFSLIYTAAKFSRKTIIQFLMNNYYDKVYSKYEKFLLHFIESINNLEMRNNLVLHFPLLTHITMDQLHMVTVPINNKFEVTTIFEVLIQKPLDKELLKYLVKFALERERYDIAYCLYKKSNIEIPEKLVPFVTLHKAVESNNISFVKLFIEFKFDINKPDCNGDTPLHFAVHNLNMVRLLLTHGAIYNRPNNKFEIPSEYVTPVTDVYDLFKEIDKAFSLQIQDFNEENIPSIFNTRNYKGQTLLHVVLEKDNNEKNKHILEIYAKKCRNYLPSIINATDSNGIKPLHIAVGRKAFGVFKQLLKYGAFFDAHTRQMINEKCADCKEFQTFIYNSDLLCSSLKKFLNEDIENKVFYLNYQDENGRTAIHRAILKDGIDQETINTLLQLNVNLDIADINGNTAIDLAVHKKDNETFEALFNAGAILRFRPGINHFNMNNDQLTYKRSLFLIENSYKKNLQSWILSQRPNLLTYNVCDTDGNTLLHHAVKHNNPEIILFLLKNGAPYNVLNNYGNSAETLTPDPVIKNILHVISDLFHAVESQKTRFLFESASDVISHNKHVSEDNENYDIKNIFMNARKQHYDNNIYNVSSLLHIAAKHGKLEIVTWLVENGAKVTTKDFTGKTAAQVAYDEHYQDISIYLIAVENLNKRKMFFPR